MIRRITIVAFLAIVALLGVFWAGFRADPLVLPPDHGSGSLTERTVLYDGLEPALQFYLQQTAGRAPWVTETAILWGTGRIRWKIGPVSLWLPLRWYEAIDAERGYAWRADIMWWSRLLFSVEDRDIDGSGQMKIAGEEADVPCLPEIQNLRATAERLWLPSTLVTGGSITWRGVSTWMLEMRRTVATGGTADLTASFSSRTRALSSLVGMSCEGDSLGSEWFVALRQWDNVAGVTVPVAATLSRNGEPIYRFKVAGMVYNADVDEWLSGDDAFAKATQRRGAARRPE